MYREQIYDVRIILIEYFLHDELITSIMVYFIRTMVQSAHRYTRIQNINIIEHLILWPQNNEIISISSLYVVELVSDGLSIFYIFRTGGSDIWMYEISPFVSICTWKTFIPLKKCKIILIWSLEVVSDGRINLYPFSQELVIYECMKSSCLYLYLLENLYSVKKMQNSSVRIMVQWSNVIKVSELKIIEHF